MCTICDPVHHHILSKESVLSYADAEIQLSKLPQLLTYHTRFIIQGRALDAVGLIAVLGLPHKHGVVMETHLDAWMILKPTMADCAGAIWNQHIAAVTKYTYHIVTADAVWVHMCFFVLIIKYMFDHLLNIDQGAVHKHVLYIDFVCFYLFSCVFCCCFVCCGGGVGYFMH